MMGEYSKAESKIFARSWVANIACIAELNIRIYELERAIRSHRNLYLIENSTPTVGTQACRNLDIHETLWASIDGCISGQRPNFNEKEAISDDLIQRYPNALNELSK